MFGIKFVRHPDSVSYLCHTYVRTTSKILYLEYQSIYQILEFSSALISVLTPKIPLRSGPSVTDGQSSCVCSYLSLHRVKLLLHIFLALLFLLQLLSQAVLLVLQLPQTCA